MDVVGGDLLGDPALGQHQRPRLLDAVRAGEMLFEIRVSRLRRFAQGFQLGLAQHPSV